MFCRTYKRHAVHIFSFRCVDLYHIEFWGFTYKVSSSILSTNRNWFNIGDLRVILMVKWVNFGYLDDLLMWKTSLS